MRTEGMSLELALAHVQEKRPVAKLNEGFMQ